MAKLRTRPSTTASGVVGTARTDRRTTALLPRLSAGDVAVLDEVDLDGPTAEALVEAGVVAVLDRSPMISGRFPNRGPQILLDAGIVMVDQLEAAGGQDPVVTIGDGRRVRVVGGSVLSHDEVVAQGREVTADVVADLLAGARTGLATQLQSLTHN
ncbi:MAG: thiamine pyrophosphokinase, partial [Nocardioides sp.]